MTFINSVGDNASYMYIVTVFIFLVEGGSNLDALKTAASSGNLDPLAVTSDMSLGRRRSSLEWYKNQLTFKLRVRDPLIAKQSECFQDLLKNLLQYV